MLGHLNSIFGSEIDIVGCWDHFQWIPRDFSHQNDCLKQSPSSIYRKFRVYIPWWYHMENEQRQPQLPFIFLGWKCIHKMSPVDLLLQK